MVAVDTSTLIAFIQGNSGTDVTVLDQRLAAIDIVLPPVVLTEFLSDPAMPAHHRELALQLPLIDHRWLLGESRFYTRDNTPAKASGTSPRRANSTILYRYRRTAYHARQ